MPGTRPSRREETNRSTVALGILDECAQRTRNQLLAYCHWECRHPFTQNYSELIQWSNGALAEFNKLLQQSLRVADRQKIPGEWVRFNADAPSEPASNQQNDPSKLPQFDFTSTTESASNEQNNPSNLPPLKFNVTMALPRDDAPAIMVPEAIRDYCRIEGLEGSINPADLVKLLREYEVEVRLFSDAASYFQIAWKRMFDVVPICIENDFVAAFTVKLQERFREEMGLTDDIGREKCKKYAVEEPFLQERKDSLLKIKKTLEEAVKIVRRI